MNETGVEGVSLDGAGVGRSGAGVGLRSGAGVGLGSEVEWVVGVSYGVLVPLVVVAGMLFNTLGLYLLTRPAMKTRPANTYLVVLVVCDLLTLAASVPTAITLNGCRLFSYNIALYFAHTSYTAFYILQTFTLYIILWISYDRFLALWAWERFHRAQGRGALWLRLSLTLLLCVGVHVRHLVDVQVVCCGSAGCWDGDEGGGCEGGMLVLQDGLHRKGRQETWQEVVWWVVRGLVVLAAPIFLVLVLNTGIVVGMVTRRLHNNAATSNTRRHALSSIYITLGVSGTFLACTLPICIHAIFFAANIQHCHGPYSEEIFRGVANLLLLLEHLTHVPLLAFNLTFRAEARKLLTALRPLALATQRYCRCTCLQLRGGHQKDEAKSHTATEVRSPPQLVVSFPEARTGAEEAVELQASQNIPLQCLTSSVARGGHTVGGGREMGDKQGVSNGIQERNLSVRGGDGGERDRGSSLLSPNVACDPASRSSTVTVIDEDL